MSEPCRHYKKWVLAFSISPHVQWCSNCGAIQAMRHGRAHWLRPETAKAATPNTERQGDSQS